MWTGSVLFFQVVLLVGYALVHGVLAPGRGVAAPSPLRLALTVVLLALPAVVLPLHVPDWAAPGDHPPLPWLLLVLTVMVGLPFLALSVAGPLVSSWLARTSRRTRRSPYRLYAASNVGSIGGLRRLPAARPSRSRTPTRCAAIWSVGYVVAAVLLVVCAARARTGAARSSRARAAADRATRAGPAPTPPRAADLARARRAAGEPHARHDDGAHHRRRAGAAAVGPAAGALPAHARDRVRPRARGCGAAPGPAAPPVLLGVLALAAIGVDHRAAAAEARADRARPRRCSRSSPWSRTAGSPTAGRRRAG